MSNVYQFMTSVIAYKLRRTYFIELEKGTLFRYHHIECVGVLLL